MKNTLKIMCFLMVICLGIVLTGLLAWWLTGGVEDDRRAKNFLYQEFQRYSNSNIRELYILQVKYAKADGKQQKSLGDIVWTRTIQYDLTKLPNDLRVFIDKLRVERYVVGPEIQLE